MSILASGRIRLLAIAVGVIALLVAAGYGLLEGQSLKAFLLTDRHTPLFVVMILLLPVIGVPISLFCLVAGSKFGALWGLAIVATAIFLHLLTHYYLMKSYLKPVLVRAIEKRRHWNDRLSGGGNPLYLSTGIALAPVIPYTIKNLVVASLDIRLPQYLLVLWPIQIAFAIPFVGITGFYSSHSMVVLAVALLALVLLVACRVLYRKRADRQQIQASPDAHH